MVGTEMRSNIEELRKLVLDQYEQTPCNFRRRWLLWSTELILRAGNSKNDKIIDELLVFIGNKHLELNELGIPQWESGDARFFGYETDGTGQAGKPDVDRRAGGI